MKLLAGLLLCAALQAAEWRTLFDGKSTEAWLEVTGLPFPASWTVADGCLKTVAPLDAFQDIRTKAVFRSFDLRFEWKIARAGNSGVKYRIEKTDRWKSRTGEGFHARARGAEYQLADDENEPDARSDPKRSTASLYGVQAPGEKAAKAVGEWNEGRIVVRGLHVEHWLNGRKVVEYEAASGKESFVALQHHNTEVWFRNIRIQEIEER
jgi:hypothetical protein